MADTEDTATERNEALYQFLLALLDEDRADALAYLEDLHSQLEDEALALPDVDYVVDTIYGGDGDGDEPEQAPPPAPVTQLVPVQDAVAPVEPARRRTTK